MRSTFRYAPTLASLGLAALVGAQEAYKQPPAPIAQILDALPTPLARLSPDRSWLLLIERDGLPPIAEVAAPELRLAGDRIDPRNNGRARTSTSRALRLRSVAGNTERRIELPAGTRIGSVSWSPDSSRIAFTSVASDRITLWLADVASGKARRASETRLNAAAGDPCAWVDASRLLCTTIPAGRGNAPVRSETPVGPVFQESAGRSAPNPTFQDLLQDPTDEALFEHFFAAQLAVIAASGEVKPIGAPGLHVHARPSPDGRFALVETIRRPFSYRVPMRRFPHRLAVWDMSGVTVKEIADTPLQESMPWGNDAVQLGPREPRWRSDAPATVVWLEASDGGDPARPAEKRDRVLALEAPFTASPAPLVALELRGEDVIWARADLALVTESWWKTRKTRTWAIDPSNPGTPRLVFERSSEDRYADPGDFLTAVTSRGTEVLLTSKDGQSAFLTGRGASPEGDRPFLDRIDLATGKTVRLWRSEPPSYEEALAVLDGDGTRALTRRESVAEAPNYYVRDVRKKQTHRLTDFPDPAPALAGLAGQIIRYKRGDGVELTATLYVPPGYDKSKGPLPFLLWAYPREFKSAAAAAQVSGSPHRFTRPSGASHLLLLTQGYGILDDPTMPIVGEGTAEPNDSYVEQLVASAQAAVDKLVELGVADPKRLAIGGHSYGAFMTANLLAHSELFRAGIARSGAYNRTLTPFGFQNEERSYWKARDTYARMSPFTYADTIKEPILLIHGMADNNTGTFPIQSERFYAALQGHGATVRLVMLPAESHGYRARESVGHTLWEMTSWLDRWVKNAEPTEPTGSR